MEFPLSPRAKRNGKGYIDHCPAHQDKTPSLSINVTPDGKLLLHCFAGCTFEEILSAAGLNNCSFQSNCVSIATLSEIPSVKDRIKQAVSIWRSTSPISGTVAECYLRSRQLNTWSEDMRFHPKLYLSDDGTKRTALVCAVRRQSRIVGIHRTFLNDKGEKLTKKMLGQCGGGSVYVGGSGDVIAVAEGIENALSARIMSGDHRAHFYAALSANGMQRLELPSTKGDLMVFADGDKVGMTAAFTFGERASLNGWNASTIVPPKDKDWNDELIARLGGTS